MTTEHPNVLAQRLRGMRSRYYNSGTDVSDAEFDALEDALRRADPSNPYFSEVGAVPLGSKVRHGAPMGSLAKVAGLVGLEEWYKGIAALDTRMVVSAKLDGLSVSMRYEGGKLVRALTRGDGEFGEDVTDGVRGMGGVPVCAGDLTGYVRGEIVMSKAAHERLPEYKSRRNAAVGITKRVGGDTSVLNVVCYQLLPDGDKVASKRAEFAALEDLGFDVAWYTDAPIAKLVDEVYHSWTAGGREEYAYDCDGLVIEIDDTSTAELAGVVDGRPNGARALKFPAETATATLRDVAWQVGASGRVTPVAVFDAVRLTGADVTHATLHNVQRIDQLTCGRGLFVGSKLTIARRGDVIPHVEASEPGDAGDSLPVPTACPACRTTLAMVGEYLTCSGIHCRPQAVGKVSRWLDALGVLGWGEAVLEAIHGGMLGFNASHVYKLDAETLAMIIVGGRQIGESQAKTMIRSLRSRMQVDLADFVAGLAIPLVARSTAQAVVDAGFNTLERMEAASVDALQQIPGVGPERAQSLVHGLQARSPISTNLLLAGVVIRPPRTTGALLGMSFCFTGFRDKGLELEIQSAGGVIKSGVSKGLTHLVMKSTESGSGKSQKAREYGTALVSVDDVRRMIAQQA